MNPAISCIDDTLRLLLDEAKHAKEAAAAKRGSPEEGFEVGRSEALTEVLHTWANQLQTFGLDPQLDGTWQELRAFLTSHGYCGGPFAAAPEAQRSWIQSRRRPSTPFLEARRKAATVSHFGQARNAISITRRRSARLAPLAAWTAIP